MAVKKSGLGKGLGALIPEAAVAEKPATKKEVEKSEENSAGSLIKISKIEPNRDQPRKNFDKEALEALSDSIRQHGVISPITVQKKGDRYIIIAGERRWRAARMAGLTEIPAYVGDYSEREIAELSLIENIQREDLNPIEEAQAYKRLMTEFNLKQEEVAERVSKSRSAITNTMRLLKLSEEVQKYLIDGTLSEGHARALLGTEDVEAQNKLAKKVIDEKLSVRDIEKLIKNLGKPEKSKTPANKEYDVFYNDIAEKLKVSLGTKVSVSGKGDGAGKIEIEFYSNDDLDRLVAKIK
ncbi:chromosome partitioning protein, ParB family [Lachnospiraceae bacterium YSD2013]|nr:chromosome partitioning protein, ParB family [Lachnospiraceae bacterium YSD2013]